MMLWYSRGNYRNRHHWELELTPLQWALGFNCGIGDLGVPFANVFLLCVRVGWWGV